MMPMSLIPQAALLAYAAIVPAAAQASWAGAAQVSQPPVSPSDTPAVVVNLRDIDIADVAQQVSRITGRTIILDPAVKGTVNVVSSRPLGPDGIWQLFTTVLRGQGFAVVRNGRAWRGVLVAVRPAFRRR